MNATVGGTPGGIQSGDVITKIEIVWKSGAETEDQAMAAGRGVTLTSPSDIAAFQASGYTLSSAALVSGQTYTPAVRVTESRSGVDGFVGGWKNGSAFTALPGVFTDSSFETTAIQSWPGWSAATPGIWYNSGNGLASIITPSGYSAANGSKVANTVVTLSGQGGGPMQLVTPANLLAHQTISVDLRINSSGTTAKASFPYSGGTAGAYIAVIFDAVDASGASVLTSDGITNNPNRVLLYGVGNGGENTSIRSDIPFDTWVTKTFNLYNLVTSILKAGKTYSDVAKVAAYVYSQSTSPVTNLNVSVDNFILS